MCARPIGSALERRPFAKTPARVSVSARSFAVSDLREGRLTVEVSGNSDARLQSKKEVSRSLDGEEGREERQFGRREGSNARRPRRTDRLRHRFPFPCQTRQ
jgi:hypothetical protein